MHLEGASLHNAHLKDIILTDAHLEDVHFDCAHLEKATLVAAHMEQASIQHANFATSNLRCANLDNALILGSRFMHANLDYASLNNAWLHETNFDGASFRGVKGLQFDRNRIEGIDIDYNASDHWSVLRRKYTGPWFFLHCSLLVLFFAPYVIQAILLTIESRAQQWLGEQVVLLDNKAEQIPALQGPLRAMVERYRQTHANRPAVWVLLGFQNGSLHLVLAAIVILYNSVRGLLTIRVSSLRDAEERSSRTPARDEYKTLFAFHRFARRLFMIAVAAVIYNTMSWVICTTVSVPLAPGEVSVF